MGTTERGHRGWPPCAEQHVPGMPVGRLRVPRLFPVWRGPHGLPPWDGSPFPSPSTASTGPRLQTGWLRPWTECRFPLDHLDAKWRPYRLLWAKWYGTKRRIQQCQNLPSSPSALTLGPRCEIHFLEQTFYLCLGVDPIKDTKLSLNPAISNTQAHTQPHTTLRFGSGSGSGSLSPGWPVAFSGLLWPLWVLFQPL